MSHPELAAQLRHGEVLVHLERVPRVVPPQPLSALHSLTRLTPQAGRAPLGQSGPIVAAGALPREGAEAPSHLRLFEALFGRDSLTCARILHPWYPGLTRRTVIALAALQGIRDDAASEQEPGRIPHEVRASNDPVARRITADAGWAWPYYGSVDATCLWITLTAEVVNSDPALADTPIVRPDNHSVPLSQCLRDAVSWLEHRLDASPSGLLESWPRFPGSIENQVWKDSWDAYSHDDGSIAQMGTIASVEVQALAHDALKAVASLSSPPTRSRLRRTAAHIRDRLLTDFWIDNGGLGFFALGLDRDAHGRPRAIAVRSSNMGHLLLSGVLDGDDAATTHKRQQLQAALVTPDMLCGAGVRTLSSHAPRFRPNGYHTGNSWPWDTYIVAAGLRRHGAHDEADDLCRRIMAGHLATRHFPEFFSGDDAPTPHTGDLIADVIDPSGRQNRICQPPQEVQAWTAAAVLAIKHTSRHTISQTRLAI